MVEVQETTRIAFSKSVRQAAEYLLSRGQLVKMYVCFKVKTYFTDCTITLDLQILDLINK